MKITQISVFLENRKGRLSEACSLLGEGGVNIRALTIAESEDYGVLRIVVDRPAVALELLKEKGFVATLTDIVAVEVPDEPGGLAKVLKILFDRDINVEYMYGFVERHSDKALLVFRFDSPDEAIDLLTRSGINVIDKKDIETL